MSDVSKKSLIEIARNHKDKRNGIHRRIVSKDELEVALAYVMGEIGSAQVRAVVPEAQSNVSHWADSIVSSAIKSRKWKIVEVTQ